MIPLWGYGRQTSTLLHETLVGALTAGRTPLISGVMLRIGKGWGRVPLIGIAALTSGTSPASAATHAEGRDWPKYGGWVQLLAQHPEPLRMLPAPDYWALSPYYVGQKKDGWCSVAALAIVVNAARQVAGVPMTSSSKLVLQDALLAAVAAPDWNEGVDSGAGYGLEPYARVIERALSIYGVKGAHAEAIETKDRGPATLARLREDLQANERSARDFIIANFVQGYVNGDQDPAARVGHYSPIGAYRRDPATGQGRVLILEVDRDYYEPYWAPEDKLLEGMVKPKFPGDHFRGYIHLWFD
jgi:hypothetical protein